MLKWNGGGNPTILNMKKYLILKDTCGSRRKEFLLETVVELDVDEGNQLVGYFKAEETTKKSKTKKADRSVGLETSEVKAPKTRAKK